MAAITDTGCARWPRDLKVFAILAALWASALTARMLIRDLMPYATTQLDVVMFGMRFVGHPARVVLAVQAMTGFTIAIGIAAERRWGLLIAFAFMLEIIASDLIFMVAYMDDIALWQDVRIAGLLGVSAVLVLLYLWIRAGDLLWREGTATRDNRAHRS